MEKDGDDDDIDKAAAAASASDDSGDAASASASASESSPDDDGSGDADADATESEPEPEPEPAHIHRYKIKSFTAKECKFLKRLRADPTLKAKIIAQITAQTENDDTTMYVAYMCASGECGEFAAFGSCYLQCKVEGCNEEDGIISCMKCAGMPILYQDYLTTSEEKAIKADTDEKKKAELNQKLTDAALFRHRYKLISHLQELVKDADTTSPSWIGHVEMAPDHPFTYKPKPGKEDILKGYNGPARKRGSNVDLTLEQIEKRRKELTAVAGMKLKFSEVDEFFGGKSADEVETCIENGSCFHDRTGFRTLVERAVANARQHQQSSSIEEENEVQKEIHFESKLLKVAEKHALSLSGKKRKRDEKEAEEEEEEAILSSDDDDRDDVDPEEEETDDSSDDEISIVPGAEDLQDLSPASDSASASAASSLSTDTKTELPTLKKGKGKDRWLKFLGEEQAALIEDGGVDFTATTDDILASQGTNAFHGVWNQDAFIKEDKKLRKHYKLPTYLAGDNPLKSDDPVKPSPTKKRRIMPESTPAPAPAAAAVPAASPLPATAAATPVPSPPVTAPAPTPAPAPAPAPAAIPTTTIPLKVRVKALTCALLGPGPSVKPVTAPSSKSPAEIFSSLFPTKPLFAESSESSGDSD